MQAANTFCYCQTSASWHPSQPSLPSHSSQAMNMPIQWQPGSGGRPFPSPSRTVRRIIRARLTVAREESDGIILAHGRRSKVERIDLGGRDVVHFGAIREGRQLEFAKPPGLRKSEPHWRLLKVRVSSCNSPSRFSQRQSSSQSPSPPASEPPIMKAVIAGRVFGCRRT